MLFLLLALLSASLNALQCNDTEFLQAGFTLYSANNLPDAYMSFAMLSGVVGCEQHGLLGAAASAARMGYCVAASHHFQLAHLTTQQKPTAVIRPLLACLRQLGINTHLATASNLEDMISSLATSTESISTSYPSQCNFSSSIPPLHASIRILDSMQQYSLDVAALSSQLQSFGVNVTTIQCQDIYDDHLHIIILPHHCSTSPANYITWSIEGTESLLPNARAEWSSAFPNAVPRFLDLSIAQLFCTTHIFGLPSSALNFYHVFSPAVELYEDYATTRLHALFGHAPDMLTLKAGLVYPTTLNDFPHAPRDLSLARFSEVILYVAPRTNDVIHNSMLYHSVQNQMLQGKLIVILAHSDDIDISPAILRAFDNSSVIITTTIDETYQQLNSLIRDKSATEKIRQNNLHFAMQKYREHLSTIRNKLSHILSSLPSKLNSKIEYGTIPCRSPFCRYPCTTCALTDKCQHYIDNFVPPASMTCPHPSNSSQLITLHPVGFATAAEDIFPCMGQKIFDFSTVLPYNKTTYIYGIQDEYEYKRNMAHSMYGVTMKKAGWDCQRHYEIIASSSVPYFYDLDSAPSHVMPFLPRELLREAKYIADIAIYQINNTPGIKMSAFNKESYRSIACCLHAFAKRYLTSKQLAEYVLDRAQVRNATSVLLLLDEKSGYDYMAAALLHGLRELFGDALTDDPFVSVYYEVPPEKGAYDIIKERFVHGMGYSWAHRSQNIAIDRSNIHARIQKHEWDVVIYGQIHRGAPYLSTVQQHYTNKEVIFIDGEDWAASEFSTLDNYYKTRTDDSWLPSQQSYWRELFTMGHYFKRELDECPK